MTWSFEQIAGPFEFTEGPIWDDGSILFSDHDCIRRYDPETDECTVEYNGTSGTRGMHTGPDGSLYVCEEAGRRLVRYEEAERAVLVDSYRGDRMNGVNDLEFDAHGRLWFTDSSYGKEPEDLDLDHKSVYRIDDPAVKDPIPVRVIDDTTQPNGILVDADIETLFVAQSEYGKGNERELRAYPIENDGALGEYEVLHNFYPHRGIDGMTFDNDGNIVATAGSEESGPGPMIYVFTPNGRVLETHPITSAPTNICFGGDDLQDLYVTAHDACLYRAQTDRQGWIDQP